MNLFGQEKDMESRLYDLVVSTFTIRCSTCKTTGSVNVDDAFDAAEFFCKQGWVADRSDNTYCRFCAEEHYVKE